MTSMTITTCAGPLKFKSDRAAEICLVCHEPLPVGGAYQAHLWASAHRGECSEAISAQERIYDQSTRGRWRPVRELFKLVNGARCAACMGRPA